MIEFGYLTGWSSAVHSIDPLTFFNAISEELSWGHRESIDNTLVVADFDALIYLAGHSTVTVADITKEFRAKQPIPLTKTMFRVWNEFLFSLYPDSSMIADLESGHIRGTGLPHPTERLYGGHVSLFQHTLELSLSLCSTELQFELWTDINLGLQCLSTIVAQLEAAKEKITLGSWRLTLRPGMLYEEIYNGSRINEQENP